MDPYDSEESAGRDMVYSSEQSLPCDSPSAAWVHSTDWVLAVRAEAKMCYGRPVSRRVSVGASC